MHWSSMMVMVMMMIMMNSNLTTHHVVQENGLIETETSVKTTQFDQSRGASRIIIFLLLKCGARI